VAFAAAVGLALAEVLSVMCCSFVKCEFFAVLLLIAELAWLQGNAQVPHAGVPEIVTCAFPCSQAAKLRVGEETIAIA